MRCAGMIVLGGWPRSAVTAHGVSLLRGSVRRHEMFDREAVL